MSLKRTYASARRGKAKVSAQTPFGHRNLHHKERVRLVLGSGVVLMGLAILATV
jgi:hypothetical protein